MQQIVNRMHENLQINPPVFSSSCYTTPQLKNLIGNSTESIYATVQFSNFILKKDIENKWFLTKDKNFMAMCHAVFSDSAMYIVAKPLKLKHSFYNAPFESKILNIYISSIEYNDIPKVNVNTILCKLYAILHNNDEYVFLPVLHTYVTQ